MNREELYAALEARIPTSLSAEWDNDGLLCCADLSAPVARVLCTLDVTDEVVRYAERGGFDLILSHHPLIFSGVRALNERTPVGCRLLDLLAADIAVFSFHTRLDAVTGGINDGLCALLGLTDVKLMGEGEAALGRVGVLPCPMDAETLAALVKERLGAPILQVADAGAPISRLAVVGGEGKDLVSCAVASGADAYLSGRLGYHTLQDAPITLMEAGHYFTERHAADLLAAMVRELAPTVYAEAYAPLPFSQY